MKQIEAWVPLLLRWYQENKRDLPWRGSKDPYDIWVSEIMLQQTRVEAVMEYYERFMKQFQTIAALAAAPEEQVLKAWEGLGYYSRAKNMMKAAQVMVKQWNGEFPPTYEEVLALPGIGEYTAGAICSIARGEARPAVDGNVLRVISRLYAMEEDVLSTRGKRRITEITERNIPEECAGEYTQSLMDLGARICIPKHPRCAECPIAGQCEARVLGIAAELPHKKKKQPPQVVQRYVMIVHKEDKVLLVKRTEQGVLSGMWEFPGIDMPSDPKMAGAMWMLEYGMHMDMPQRLFSAEHIFSHIHWMMDVHLVKATADPVMDREWRWVNKQELEELMIPTAFRAIRNYVMEEL